MLLGTHCLRLLRICSMCPVAPLTDSVPPPHPPHPVPVGLYHCSRSKARLEVRFEGETGFDDGEAGSGVTRGFYADIAESLQRLPASAGLPTMWIPDPEPGNEPQAMHSAHGLFPLPLPPGHPSTRAVALRFRFLGRLMAVAMRDKFVVPLLLSAGWWKIVRHAAASAVHLQAGGHSAAARDPQHTWPR